MITEGHKILSDRIIATLHELKGHYLDMYVISLEAKIRSEIDIQYNELIPSYKDWFSSSIKIIRFLSENRVDLVHILAFNKVFFTVLFKMARLGRKNPKIIAHLYYHPMAFKFLEYKPIELLIKAKSFNGIFTTSNYLRDYLVSELSIDDRMVWVIPPLVPQEFFKIDYKSAEYTSEIRRVYGFDENDFVIAYIGHIIPQRGIFELLKAFAEATKLNSDLKLVISYPNIIFKDLSYDYLSILRRMVDKYGLKDKVLILGKQLLTRIYAAADILFFGFSDSFYFTYPPLVVCEAMAAGVPFILKKSSLIKELFGDNVPVPVYEDVDNLTNILLEVANSRRALIDISRKLKSIAEEKFSPMSVINKLYIADLAILGG
jgi:glycosyltransferase involved in cell wall biosynthesis